MVKAREWLWTWETLRQFCLGAGVLCGLGAAVWFGYTQFFTKGLERLPATLCDGTVERDMVTQVLPPARYADEYSHGVDAGHQTRYSCSVATSNDARVWSTVEISSSTFEDMLKNRPPNARLIRASADGIEAYAASDKSTYVYVPCTPPVTDPSDDEYALVARVDAWGDTAITGAPLRQALTDIGYRIAQHVYKLAECQDDRTWPDQLPPYDASEAPRER
ncbi:hypothetical protein [Streptomyces flavalbus]|uniref:Uncharacterized protein n=1 Tax=Streptomyces flavalbus TaxID=2665155 RepID=A0ABW2WH08_9ACTN